MASLASSLGLCKIPSLGTYKKVISSLEIHWLCKLEVIKNDLRERSYEFGIRKGKTDELKQDLF